MSVLVKGIKMPTECSYCPVFSRESGCCAAIREYMKEEADDLLWLMRERPDWCPLVEVPTPHSDLIDREKLRAKEFTHDGDAYAVVMSRDIRNAPTIIPAEEGET